MKKTKTKLRHKETEIWHEHTSVFLSMPALPRAFMTCFLKAGSTGAVSSSSSSEESSSSSSSSSSSFCGWRREYRINGFIYSDVVKSLQAKSILLSVFVTSVYFLVKQRYRCSTMELICSRKIERCLLLNRVDLFRENRNENESGHIGLFNDRVKSRFLRLKRSEVCNETERSLFMKQKVNS